jgi:hypothetical protein
MVLRPTTLKKISKLDPEELLFWISACQLPKVNRERKAIIEYLAGVIVSNEYMGGFKKKISRKVIEGLFHEAFEDLDNYVGTFKDDMLCFSFSLGYLTIRGEAFPWQLARTAIERYEPHSEWMNQKLGFTIHDAVEFTKTIMKEVTLKSIRSFPPSFPEFTKEQYYDPRYIFIPSKSCAIFLETSFMFSIDYLRSKISPSKHNQLDRYLERMSIDLQNRPAQLASIGDYNPLNGRPLIKIKKNYLLPFPPILWRALSNTFHYDLLADASYRGKYISVKGEVAERRVENCLAKLFEKDEIHTRVKYSRRKGLPDVDILIDDDNATVLVECTSKWITQEAKKGYLESIVKDLRQSVEKCYKQLARANAAILDRQIVTRKTGKILPIIVVDDFIPNLDSILRYSSFLGEPLPYIISAYDLDIITDLVEKNDFVDFVGQRIEMSKNPVMFCTDEIDYFVFYKMHGFAEYIEKLQRNKSELHYIGHLENLFPTYYGEKLREFLNDSELEFLLEAENLELLEGWS